MQAEEAQLRSTKITGYVINETAVFGFCLDWRSWGHHSLCTYRRTTTLRMGITCVIECFRVLAYYRCYDEIIPGWLFCFVRLAPSSLSTLLSNYKLHIVRLSCPPSAFAGRRVVCGRAAKTRTIQAKRRTCHWNQQSQVHLIVYLRRPEAQKPRLMLWCCLPERKKKTILPVWTPQRPSSAPCQPPSTGGRNCFFIFSQRDKRSASSSPLLTSAAPMMLSRTSQKR